MDTIQDFIQTEFSARKSNNPSYSLAAFARDLNISKSRLSEVLSGKGGLSEKYAISIVDNLDLSEHEKELFFILIRKNHSRSKKIRFEAELEFKSYKERNKYNIVSPDDLKVISDWYHFAILAVMDCDEYDGSKEFILSKINIEQETLDLALDRLKKLLYISEVDGSYVNISSNLTTTNDIPHRAIKNYHKQNLENAKRSIDEVPVEFRDVTSISMAIDSKKIPEAKKKIANFRKELASFLEKGEKNSVYSFCIQLFPVGKSERL